MAIKHHALCKRISGNRPKFIRLLLKSLRLDRFAAATGVPSLNRNFVHPIKVAVPEPSEQHQIVDIIEDHDARIRTEKQYSDKLKLQKRGLMHDLLTGIFKVYGSEVAEFILRVLLVSSL